MNRFCIAIILLLLLLLGTAVAEKCSYTGGEHEYAQVDVTLPTCEHDGYIYLRCPCGAEETQVTKSYGHSWTEYNRAEPDCTHSGTSYQECEECHARRAAKLEPKGHRYTQWTILREATCAREGLRSSCCEVCGNPREERIPAKAHTFGEWRVIVEPTDSTQGERTHTCAVCGAEVSERFYPSGTLYPDMPRGSAVRAFQLRLIETGWLNDRADGIFGKKTEQAVRDFQAANGLEVTGIAYPQTLKALETSQKRPNGELTPAPQPSACCDKHQSMLDFDESLLAHAATEAERLSAYARSRSLWENELNRLYESRASALDEAAARALREERSAFRLSLAVMEAAQRGEGKSELEIAEHTLLQLQSQCAALCAQEESS